MDRGLLNFFNKKKIYGKDQIAILKLFAEYMGKKYGFYKTQLLAQENFSKFAGFVHRHIVAGSIDGDHEFSFNKLEKERRKKEREEKKERDRYEKTVLKMRAELLKEDLANATELEALAFKIWANPHKRNAFIKELRANTSYCHTGHPLPSDRKEGEYDDKGNYTYYEKSKFYLRYPKIELFVKLHKQGSINLNNYK